VVVGAATTACGTSLSDIVGSTSTTSTTAPPSPSTAATSANPQAGGVSVAFPVVICTTGTGAALSSSGWRPSYLLAPVPTSLVGKVEFYSDGLHTVLGPIGWSCSQTLAPAGSSGLVVYPPNNPNPPVLGPPAAGTEGIFATYDTTGHAQGVALVCPFFTVPTWQQQEAKCATTKVAGEQSSLPTPDVAAVTDPSGVVGTLAGSGGVHPVTGTVIFPQVVPAVTNGSAVNVAEESCSLVDTTLCPTVLADFEVREFPVPATALANQR
jgi:hypothetical protein